MSRLTQLALNDDGFVFDPSTGDSYTLNSTGLFILRLLRQSDDLKVVARELSGEFDVSAEDAERDVADFLGRLKNFRLA